MERFEFDMAGKRITTDTAPEVVAGAFSDLDAGAAFVVVGTEIHELGAGAGRVGQWRSPRLDFPSGSAAGFSWLRLAGRFSAGAQVRLFADGALVYTTPVISTKEPLRVPAIEARRWEVEIESADRISQLVLASTTEELRG